jgi:hypothetical protein
MRSDVNIDMLMRRSSFKALSTKLKKIVILTERLALKRALTHAATPMGSDARHRAPVRTGALRRSIQISNNPSNLSKPSYVSVKVGINPLVTGVYKGRKVFPKKYATIVEAIHPSKSAYMRTAFDTQQQNAIAAFAKSITVQMPIIAKKIGVIPFVP